MFGVVPYSSSDCAWSSGTAHQDLLLLTDDNGAYEQNCWPVAVVKLDLDFS